MPDLGTAYVQIVPSARGISGSIQNILGGEADAAGAAAGGKISGKIKGVLAAAGIGAALTAGIAKSVSEGGKLEQSIGGIETMFKSYSGKMIKNADEAFKTAGISANDYMEQVTSFSASLLQSTGGNTKKAGQAAHQAILDMSDNANKFGTNIADIQHAYQGFAKQNYTMLDNLKLGYGGTKTEMQRLLSDAQKISGQKYDIKNLDDVYEAIHVIQSEMGVTGTTAKEASSTISGSFNSMKAAAANLMGDLALGRNIGPAMKGLAESAATFLFQNLFPAIGRIFKSLPEAISTFISTGLPLFTSAGGEMISSLATGIQNAVPNLLSKIPNVLDLGVQLVDKIVAGMTQGAPILKSRLPAIVGSALNAITTYLPMILSKGRQMIVHLAQGLWQNLPTFIDTVRGVVEKLPEFLDKNLPVIAAEGGKLVSQLAKAFVTNLPQIIAAAAKLGLAIINAIVKLVPTLFKTGKSLVSNLAKGLGGAALGAIKAAARAIANAVTSPIKAIIGKIKGYAKSVRTALSFSGLKGKVASVWNGIKEAIMKPIETAKSKVTSIVAKIKGIFPLHIGRVFSGLSLPHFSVSGGSAPWGIGGKGSMPHFSVSWYRKAMGEPYLFDRPSLFGAGEAGDEMLYGRRALMQDIREAAGGNRQQITNNYYITVDGAENPTSWAEEFLHAVKMDMRMV